MSTRYYATNNIWFNYVQGEMDPKIIDSVITETYIRSPSNRNIDIHLDIYDDKPNNPKREVTIIFIHGTAVYSRFYAEFLYGLFKLGYRIVALDLPGHGLSGGNRGHFNMEELVGSIYDVVSYAIDQFPGKYILLGSSLGGIATLYAIANDPRLHAGICMNAAILNEKAHKEIVKVKGFYKVLKPFVPLFAKILPSLRLSVWIYLDPKLLVKKEESLKVIDVLLSDPLITSKYTLKSLATQMTSAPVKKIEEIETPIMLINGSNDVLFSTSFIEKIYNRLERSRNKAFEIIPNSSHLIFNENIGECLSRINNWIKKAL